MNLSRQQTKQLQGLAILLMLGLHLFNRGDIEQIYSLSGIAILGKPLLLYISYIFDACVPIYLFCSGYGNTEKAKKQNNDLRTRLFGLKPLIIKYWLVVLATCLIGYLLGMQGYPGSVWKLVSNLLLLQNSYVGALWFMQTYVLLTMLFGFFYTTMNKHRRTLILSISFAMYIAAFAMEFVLLPKIKNLFVNLLVYPIVLLLRSQFAYLIGIGVAIRPLYRLSKWIKVLSKASALRLAILIGVIGLRGILANMIFAPFSAVVLIILFCSRNGTRKTIKSEKILLFFGKHSTNIWMVHMQLYMIFASSIIFWSSIPLVVYNTLLLASLAISYGIMLFERVSEGARLGGWKNVCTKQK